MADELHPGHLGNCFALIEASLLLQQGVEGMLRTESGLTFIQFRLLVTLADARAGMRMTDLADQLVLSRSGLTYQADALEARGLIVRVPSKDDERSMTATATAAGHVLADRMLPRYLDTVRSVVRANLTDEEVQQFIRSLGLVRDSMRPVDRMPGKHDIRARKD